MPDSDDSEKSRSAATLRALRRHRSRLERKREAVRGDLAEAERGPELRRAGEALLAFLRQVPKGAARVSLPDPADPSTNLQIELDPGISSQANASRYFKAAAKAERGLQEVPSRLEAVEGEIKRTENLTARIEEKLSADGSPTEDPTHAKKSTERGEQRKTPSLARLLDEAFDLLPPLLRKQVGPPASSTSAHTTPGTSAARRRAPQLPARLTPRRLRSSDGWHVLIGRTNEGNDHLTHRIARPEDYWFHVHGAAGSHVVLRRGKGKNEPSKQTIEEVAAWAAFYSQARTAGKVPVIVTRKKYVRKPRKGPPGLAICEREKTIIVRPVEPPRTALAEDVKLD